MRNTKPNVMVIAQLMNPYVSRFDQTCHLMGLMEYVKKAFLP